jgi:hypothetical protein
LKDASGALNPLDPGYKKPVGGPGRTIVETQSHHESELTLSQILGEKKKKVTR